MRHRHQNRATSEPSARDRSDSGRWQPLLSRHALRRLGAAVWLLQVLPLPLLMAQTDLERQHTSPEPAFELREQTSQYVGPYGPTVDPADVDDVVLAYFGPGDSKHPVAGELWLAAQRAIREANAAGGLQGKPFRLLPVWSEQPWGTGIAELSRVVYQQPVWAIIGGIDGPSTHLVEQVVAKARLVQISPISSDKSVNLAHVPWTFSVAPGDHRIAPVLAEAIQAECGDAGLVLVSATDHDSRHMTRALRQSLARLQMGPRFQFELREATPEELDALSRRILDAGPGGVAVVANAAETATIMNRLRGAGFRGSLFGGPSVASAGFQQAFQQALPGAKGRIVYPLLADPAALAPGDSRAEISPGARCMVDAVQLAIAAIRQAGLNRARIRDAVVELSPYRGVSGVIRWDRLGSNTRSVSLAEVGGPLPVLSGD